MMNCYKCNSTEELSAKKTDRHGNITFICKPCRRAQARKYYYNADSTPSRVGANAISREWVQRAKEKNGQIAAKYRDEKFLAARGLL